MRVVADHARATTFLIADGVIPSNEWRGYVLRKIMRRAMRHGKHLGLAEPFLHQMVAVLDREMGDAYPELRANREMVEKTIIAEENRFDAVLTDGLPRLEAAIAEALNAPERVLPGDVAFRLYDTFGMPYDFIEDTAATKDLRGRSRRLRCVDGGAARQGPLAERVRRDEEGPEVHARPRTISQIGDQLRGLREPPRSPAFRWSQSGTMRDSRSRSSEQGTPGTWLWPERLSISRQAVRCLTRAPSSTPRVRWRR